MQLANVSVSVISQNSGPENVRTITLGFTVSANLQSESEASVNWMLGVHFTAMGHEIRNIGGQRIQLPVVKHGDFYADEVYQPTGKSAGDMWQAPQFTKTISRAELAVPQDDFYRFHVQLIPLDNTPSNKLPVEIQANL